MLDCSSCTKRLKVLEKSILDTNDIFDWSLISNTTIVGKHNFKRQKKPPKKEALNSKSNYFLLSIITKSLNGCPV